MIINVHLYLWRIHVGVCLTIMLTSLGCSSNGLALWPFVYKCPSSFPHLIHLLWTVVVVFPQLFSVETNINTELFWWLQPFHTRQKQYCVCMYRFQTRIWHPLSEHVNVWRVDPRQLSKLRAISQRINSITFLIIHYFQIVVLSIAVNPNHTCTCGHVCRIVVSYIRSEYTFKLVCKFEFRIKCKEINHVNVYNVIAKRDR